jgi:hypothetical protein
MEPVLGVGKERQRTRAVMRCVAVGIYNGHYFELGGFFFQFF